MIQNKNEKKKINPLPPQTIKKTKRIAKGFLPFLLLTEERAALYFLCWSIQFHLNRETQEATRVYKTERAYRSSGDSRTELSD